MKRKFAFWVSLTMLVGTWITSCNSTKKEDTSSTTPETATMAEGASSIATPPFKPVPLPDPKIPNFKFPEDSTLINSWVKKNDEAKMAQHSWGIWTALTMPSGESYQGQPLLVFDTWYTPQDIQAFMVASQQTTSMMLEQSPRTRATLKKPRQFDHNGRKLMSLQNCTQTDPAGVNNVLVTVKYDPAAANHAVQNKLFNATTMKGYLSSGNTMVPTFPNNAISTKPTYLVITKSSLDNNGLFLMKTWTGPKIDTAGFPPSCWPAHIYVDINNKGKGNGSVALAGQGPTPQTTYNVNDFINFKVDSGMLPFLVAEGITGVNVGDYVILVAMHVTTKEVRRWTWQTYFWTANPDKPAFPSTAVITANRPAQLQGAARHYAMTTAYTYINPDQPYSGGKNVGTPILGYNPYLEAGFDAATFADALGRKSEVKTLRGIFPTNMGVRTNCIACHAQANYNPNNLNTALGYVGDRYIDMADPRFKGTLQLDFLWSLDNPK